MPAKNNITITASMLYDYVQCPHRVYLDIFGDPSRKDPVSAFIQLLWEKGNAFEGEVIEGLDIPFTNLRLFPAEDRHRLTIEAMKRGDTLIYGGRIRAGDLLGDPDILRGQGSGYAAGDIKSGAGVEGNGDDTDGKPKKHYAVQLSLYTDILERLGVSSGRKPFIWDIHGEQVNYYLDKAPGVRSSASLWDTYLACLENTRQILSKTEWPTRDYSIKTLASYLGFKWRDTHPSGAASIEWYHRWVESKDPAVRRRILEYNEDDCVATRVLLDGIRKLDVKQHQIL